MNMTAARPGRSAGRAGSRLSERPSPAWLSSVCSRCLSHSCHQLGDRDSGAGRLASTAVQRSRTAPSQASAPRRGRCVPRHLGRPGPSIRPSLPALVEGQLHTNARSALDWCSPPTCAPAANSSSASGLLISDLGRSKRFVAMLRIVKPSSPMSMGTWCLTAFGNVMGAAVAGRWRAARALGAASAVVGATSARTPACSSRQRPFRPGHAAAFSSGRSSSPPRPPPARRRLGSRSPPRGCPRAGPRASRSATSRRARCSTSSRCPTSTSAASDASPPRFMKGSPGRLFGAAKLAAAAGLALKALHPVTGRHGQNAASILYFATALAFRFACVSAGRASAADDEAVALTARRRQPS